MSTAQVSPTEPVHAAPVPAGAVVIPTVVVRVSGGVLAVVCADRRVRVIVAEYDDAESEPSQATLLPDGSRAVVFDERPEIDREQTAGYAQAASLPVTALSYDGV